MGSRVWGLGCRVTATPPENEHAAQEYEGGVIESTVRVPLDETIATPAAASLLRFTGVPRS